MANHLARRCGQPNGAMLESDMKKLQAKTLTDADVIKVIARVGGSLFAIQDAFAPIPHQVVLAKLRSMLKRKLLTGCDCGCRGDFSVRTP